MTGGWSPTYSETGRSSAYFLSCTAAWVSGQWKCAGLQWIQFDVQVIIDHRLHVHITNLDCQVLRMDVYIVVQQVLKRPRIEVCIRLIEVGCRAMVSWRWGTSAQTRRWWCYSLSWKAAHCSDDSNFACHPNLGVFRSRFVLWQCSIHWNGHWKNEHPSPSWLFLCL